MTVTNRIKLTPETTLRAVAERDWGIVVEHVRHIPSVQRTYCTRHGKVLMLQTDKHTGVRYTIDATTKTLIIADGE